VRAWAGLVLLGMAACSADPGALVPANRITGDAILQPLTAIPGDRVSGEALFANRDQGHCILCHKVSGLRAEFQGTIGPDLSHVGDRLSPAQLRLRIVDYQLVRPGALMPSYYRIHDLYQVEEAYVGETILSAQDVEDIIAYLAELKQVEEDA